MARPVSLETGQTDIVPADFLTPFYTPAGRLGCPKIALYHILCYAHHNA